MKQSLFRLLAVLFAFALIASACGDDDDDTGTAADTVDAGSEESEPESEPAESEPAESEPAESEPAESEGGGEDIAGAEVTITGPERDESEAGAIQIALDAFAEEAGITITYTGDADWEANINTQVEGGNPPDISIFPQPGKLADFARDGHVVALNEATAAATAENWSEAWTVFGNVDGTQYGVPVKSDLKSLVWYQPARFEEAGYAIPETLDDLVALSDQMIADGNTPWCVGIESGQATGWTYTDWVEDVVLRTAGPDVYDQWVSHDIPFNDPQIVEAMQFVLDQWSKEGATFSSAGSIAATAFQDNGQPLVDGDCFMHRQASFYAAFFPVGTVFADPANPDAVDVFYFPSTGADRPVLGAGTLAAGFNDEPATMAVLEYMSTPAYAEARQVAQTELKEGGLSGFLSAVNGQDPSVYQPLEQSFLEILETAEVVRFDASDLMPADVGAGTFWSAGTSAVNGDIDAAEAADLIEDSWPAG